jgi:hypothetical protein
LFEHGEEKRTLKTEEDGEDERRFVVEKATFEGRFPFGSSASRRSNQPIKVKDTFCEERRRTNFLRLLPLSTPSLIYNY